MEILSNIQKLNDYDIKPDVSMLRKRVKVTKTHLDLIISDLFKEEYIDSQSRVRDFEITREGTRSLELYRNDAKDFASHVLRMYHSTNKEGLYDYIINNKDLLWFAYYERFLTKDQIKKVARKLDASIARIWWDKTIQTLGSRYQTSWD